MTTIYCYSATGNTYALAQMLSGALGDCAIRPCDPVETHPDADLVGFLFPVYYAGLPRGMETLLRLFPARPGTDYFAVATHGGLPGNALPLVRSILRGVGADLRYAAAVRAVGTSLDLYNVKVDRGEATLRSMRSAAQGIAAGILSGKAKKGGVRLPFLDGLAHYPEPDADRAFIVNREACTGCMRCVRACVCRNIDMIDQRPVWNGHCDHCLACVHWCPVQAIDYGVRTVGKARYHCPGVTLEELPR